LCSPIFPLISYFTLHIFGLDLKEQQNCTLFSTGIGKFRYIFVFVGGGAAYLPPPQFADGSNNGGDRGDFSADSGGSLLGVSAATLVSSGPTRRCQNNASDTQPLLLASSFRHSPITLQMLMSMSGHVKNIWFGNIAASVTNKHINSTK
jgi:hypothetical protein